MIYDVTVMTPSTISELTSTLQKLVAFQSIHTDIDQKSFCIDYIANQLSGDNLHLTRGQSDGLPWLVVTTQDTKQPKLLLQAHIDVVPAKSEQFTLTEDLDRLFGRGAYDMKFAAACYLQLIRDLNGVLDKYDFGLMFTSDEEVGGENGVGYLLDQGFGSEICVIPDGGDNWILESECNGAWLVEIVAHGKSAHGSRPWEGENAIDKLIDCLEKVRKVFPMNDHDKNTISISRVIGGDTINQVPAEARATLDMRFIDNDAYTAKRVDIESVVQNFDLDLETIARVDNVKVDTKQPEIENFMKIAENVRGKAIEYGRSYGASDAHYFTSKGIPTILIRPEGGGAHSDQEWISKQGLAQFYQVLNTYVREVAIID